ncbi:MAG: DUF4142 domain-containing protein [Thiohalomonadaceae bacterium]
MNHAALLALAILVTVTAGCAGNGGNARPADATGAVSTPGVSVQDRNFVVSAAQASQAEIELATLAQRKSASPAIQQFAGRMITDHGNTRTRLGEAAREEGIVTPSSIAPRHAQIRDQLAQLSGRQFDQQYLEAQVNMHREAVDLFRQQASLGQSPELRSFAEQTLPLLEGHLNLAQQLAARAGVSFSE